MTHDEIVALITEARRAIRHWQDSENTTCLDQGEETQCGDEYVCQACADALVKAVADVSNALETEHAKNVVPEGSVSVVLTRDEAQAAFILVDSNAAEDYDKSAAAKLEDALNG